MPDDDLDFEIGFYEDLLKEKPDLVAALIPLGDAYTRKGLYGKGLEVDLRLAVLRPSDPVVRYNLACDYSLLEDVTRSLEELEMAVRLGYNDFDHLAEDPDLAYVRNDRRYKEWVLAIIKERAS